MPPRLEIRTATPLPDTVVRGLPGVVRATSEGLAWRLETLALNQTLAAVAAAAHGARAEVEEIQIYRPTLDDAFAQLLADDRP